jgi:hypothetical protein
MHYDKLRDDYGEGAVTLNVSIQSVGHSAFRVERIFYDIK